VIEEGLSESEKFEADLSQLEQRFGGQAQAQAANFTGQMQQLSNAFGDTLEAAGKLLEFLVTDMGAGIGTLTGFFEGLTSFIGTDLILVISELRAQFSIAIGVITLKLAELFQFLSKLPDRLGGGKFQEYARILTDVADDQAEFAEQLRETGNQAATSVGNLVQVTNQTKEVAAAVQVSTESVKDFNDVVQNDFLKTVQDMVDSENDRLQTLEDQSRMIDQIAIPANEAFAATLQEMNDTTEPLIPLQAELARTTREISEASMDAAESTSIFGDTLDQLPNLIIGAIQGGGDVGRTIGAGIGKNLGQSLGESLTESIGGQLGGLIGGFAGPLGTLFGGALGGVFDSIGGLFRDAEEEVNDIRDAFFEAEGGFENLAARLAQVTDEDLVKQIFDAETVDEFNAAVMQVQDTLNTSAQAQQALQEATERYGFTIEELGPAMQRQELDKQAAQLLQDFQLLTASGIDVGVVIERMGGSLVDFVNTAKATGQAVPEAMRPVIDQLIASGQLVDENGNAFESAEDAGISFAQSMSEQFQTLIERIDDFVSAITGVRPEPITIPVRFDTPRGGPSNVNIPGLSPNFDIPEFQEGGIVTTPTVGLIGEAGPEAVIPLSQMNEQMNTSPAAAEFSSDQMSQLARTLSKSIRDAMLQTA
jgi:DNA-binding ferritin-like protein